MGIKAEGLLLFRRPDASDCFVFVSMLVLLFGRRKV